MILNALVEAAQTSLLVGTWTLRTSESQVSASLQRARNELYSTHAVVLWSWDQEYMLSTGHCVSDIIWTSLLLQINQTWKTLPLDMLGCTAKPEAKKLKNRSIFYLKNFQSDMGQVAGGVWAQTPKPKAFVEPKRRVNIGWLHTSEPRFNQQSIIQAPWLKELAPQEVLLGGEMSVRNSPTAGVPGGEPWSRLWVKKGCWAVPVPSLYYCIPLPENHFWLQFNRQS